MDLYRIAHRCKQHLMHYRFPYFGVDLLTSPHPDTSQRCKSLDMG